MQRPPRLIERAVEPERPSDLPRMLTALHRLAAEDPGFAFTTDPESNQTVVAGVSEAQLEANLQTLHQQVACRLGGPQIAYRETITQSAEIDYTHKRQRDGAGEYARIKLRFAPQAQGAGYAFENRIVGGSVPDAYVPGVENGLASSRMTGVLAGFPVIDFKASLLDGAYHDIDSSVLAFEIAARAAFREGLPKAKPVLLEPVVIATVTTAKPATVVARLHERGGDPVVVAGGVQATMRLGSLLGFGEELGTEGSLATAFSHYAPVDRPTEDPPFAPDIGKRA